MKRGNEMAKVLITGALEWVMKDRNTGENIHGFTVYFDAPVPSKGEFFAAGQYSGKLRVDNAALKLKMMQIADYSAPFEAELIAGYNVSENRSELVDIVF